MPTYSIDGPDGKTYSIDGPDGATRDQVIAKIKERQPDIAAPEPSTIGDMASSFGRGITKGAIGLVGLPGDAAKLLNEGINKGEEAFGMKPPPSADIATSGQITKGVESVFGKFGEPQTTPGKYAESVGEFVPSAVIGPGGILMKAATTLAGGLGAEAGGELAGEPGRFVGGLVGGGAAGLGAAEAKAAKLSSQLPGDAAHVAASKAAYKAIENARLQTTMPAAAALSGGLKADLENQLIDQSEAPAVFRAIDNIADKKNPSVGEIASIMGLYENLGKIGPEQGTKYAAASIARQGILDWVEKLQPGDLMAGDAKFTSAMWDHARANWMTHKKLEMIEKAKTVGERRAGSTGTGANTQNAMRQRIREILDSDKKSRGMTPAVKQKMEEIVMGTWATNAARHVGKYAPSGPVSATTSILAGMEAGVPAGAAIALGATLAKHLGTYLTRRQIRELEDMLKSSSPIGRPVAAAQAAQAPNYRAILPAAALRSELATSAASPLAAGQQ